MMRLWETMAMHHRMMLGTKFKVTLPITIKMLMLWLLVDRIKIKMTRWMWSITRTIRTRMSTSVRISRVVLVAVIMVNDRTTDMIML